MVKERNLALDVIKIISALMVITIHIASIKWYVLDVLDIRVFILNGFNSLARVSVPMFVMISGYIMLGSKNELRFKDIFRKHVLRVIIVYVVWSILYALFSLSFELAGYSGFEIVKQIIYRSISGPIHFWYLIMLIGLYLITPFIKQIIQRKNLQEAFIWLALIMIILKSLREIIVIDTIELYLVYLNFNFTLGYVIYYVLGHYLMTYSISKRLTRTIYAVGIGAVLFTFIMTHIYNLESMVVYDGFFGYLRPNIIFSSTAAFVFLRRSFEFWKPNENVKAIISFLSKHNFGVYIVHLFFVGLVGRLSLMDVNISYLILIPVYTLAVYGMSVLSVFLISYIPLIKRYLL